jgi:type IV pilus assembly protein PilW
MKNTLALRLRQAGFTLVELLVAMIVGMLVVLASVASMLGTRSIAMTGDDVNALHQSSEFAFRLLGQQIRQAGYIPVDPTGPLFYFDVNANRATNVGGDAAFFAIKGKEASDRSVNDSLKVGYAPNPNYFVDCLRQRPRADRNEKYNPDLPSDPGNVRLVTSEFSVEGGVLRCLGSGSRASMPIVEGVERFDVMYGVGAVAGSDQVVRYVTANDVASFDLVRTVRICLQLSGSSRSNPHGKYTDCDGTEQASADGKLRRVYAAVFALRNNLGAL